MKSDNAVCEPNVSGIIEEITDHDNVDSLAVGETLYIKLEGLGECEFFGINEKSGFDEQDEDVPEEVMPAKMFTLKEFTEVFQDLGSTKDKMLEVISAQKGV